MLDSYGTKDYSLSSDYGKVDVKNIPNAFGKGDLSSLIDFTPSDKCKCTQVGFVQLIHVENTVNHENITLYSRRTKDGWAVDKGDPDAHNGWYGMTNDHKVREKNPNYILRGGHAIASDDPNSPRKGRTYKFHTYIICFSGKDAGKIYAQISWGFQIYEKGNVLPDTPDLGGDLDKKTRDSVIDAWNNERAPTPDPTDPDNGTIQKSYPHETLGPFN